MFLFNASLSRSCCLCHNMEMDSIGNQPVASLNLDGFQRLSCKPSGQNGKLLFPVFLPDGHAKTTGEWQVKELSSSLTVIKKLPERLPPANFYLRMLFQPYSECCSQFENTWFDGQTFRRLKVSHAMNCYGIAPMPPNPLESRDIKPDASRF